jgi:hypothetical protein
MLKKWLRASIRVPVQKEKKVVRYFDCLYNNSDAIRVIQ